MTIQILQWALAWLTCITCRQQIIPSNPQNPPFEAKDKPREKPTGKQGQGFLIAQPSNCCGWKLLRDLIRDNSMMAWIDEHEG